MNLEIWDVSGQDKFRSLTNMYFRDADAAILVYDVTDRNNLTICETHGLKTCSKRHQKTLK